MKNLLLLIAIIMLSFACGSKKQVNFQLRLTGTWYFQLDEENVGETQAWYRPDYPLQGKEIAETIGDWDALAGRPYDGRAWYFLEFDFTGVPDKAALAFESIDDQAWIWLNGEFVGQHLGANQAFKLDVDRIIKKGKNRLALAINDLGGPGGLNGAIDVISYQVAGDLLKGKYFGTLATSHPKWIENAVLYEVNVRQYTQEGTFNAFASHLPALKDLGVDIIWLMPIHPIGELNRKGTLGSYYSIKDYYGINPEFGSLADFRNLVQQIHQAGMRVIIDLVANHTSWDNPLLEQHPEWYKQNSAGQIIAPVPDWSDVAALNYDNPELRAYMIEMMQYWVRDLGIDGYRCDVAALVPMDFWQQAYQQLVAIKPVFMLAEAEAPECHLNGFHMTYASHMYWLFNDIALGKAPASDIFAKLQFEYYNYPDRSIFMRFTSNHDQNTWHGSELERYGRQGAQAFAVLTVVLPGMPLIYSGQEIAMAKRLEFFERDPIVWEENEFRAFYRSLFRAFHQHPCLHHYQTQITRLATDADTRVFAAALQKDQDLGLALINLSSQALTCEIDFAGFSGNFEQLFTQGQAEIAGGKTKIQFEPWEYRLLLK